jgi:NSS family neurotransmitter:Na+ symporter
MFYAMPGGAVLAPLFYLLVAFAALTSTISLLEVVASYFIDQRGWSRRKATTVTASIIFLTGAFAALSLGAVGPLSSWAPLGESRAGVFSVLDYLASNWALPLGGICIAVFVGWVLPDRLTREEVELGAGPFRLHWVWKLLLRVVCPLAIGWIVVAVLSGRSFS